jgi:hypothetical protein
MKRLIIKTASWLAVASIIAISVCQRRPRPNAVLLEE